ncbi:probable serine/threonine-protein kinase roco4 [Lingula anatina]|uniref:Probable serine/threonine-protein kinase roco4 n=1 Tax=Lingula anatina TaxID=7574 RepID=A0A1S3IEA5_LINAN|nr:probable serine/threonine-protein kinase roco4 [Lingula anatina]|eukprot:XP_013396488.1 probable serine/threonine-protein kinase roco4 [Lingula anatina]
MTQSAPPGGSVSPDRIAEEIYSKNIDRRLLDKIESLAQGEPVHPEKQITIWDFAGQDVYYTTHQTFLSEQNIYLLVFRLDVDLDAKIRVYRREKTVKEFIVYWLNSIHMHTVGKLKEEDKNVSPYVLLIGTHKDKLPSQEAAEEIIGNLRDYLDDKHELKKHIYLSFAISNLAKNEEFMRWFQLEMDLAKKSEQKPIIDIKELREIARSVGILEAELHEMFIPYHHRLGDVLHFKVDGLENVVILDPQWLADLFSKIMTPPVSKSGEDRLDFLKLGLEKGELDEEVFDVYLQEKKMTKRRQK